MDTAADPSAPRVPSFTVGELSREQLEVAYGDIRAEYNTTSRVVAVLTERLLAITGGEAVYISDDVLMGCADLHAHRDDQHKLVAIAVTR